MLHVLQLGKEQPAAARAVREVGNREGKIQVCKGRLHQGKGRYLLCLDVAPKQYLLLLSVQVCSEAGDKSVCDCRQSKTEGLRASSAEPCLPARPQTRLLTTSGHTSACFA